MTFMIHFSVITYTDFILGHVLLAWCDFLLSFSYGIWSGIKKIFPGGKGKMGGSKIIGWRSYLIVLYEFQILFLPVNSRFFFYSKLPCMIVSYEYLRLYFLSPSLK